MSDPVSVLGFTPDPGFLLGFSLGLLLTLSAWAFGHHLLFLWRTSHPKHGPNVELKANRKEMARVMRKFGRL